MSRKLYLVVAAIVLGLPMPVLAHGLFDEDWVAILTLLGLPVIGPLSAVAKYLLLRRRFRESHLSPLWGFAVALLEIGCVLVVTCGPAMLRDRYLVGLGFFWWPLAVGVYLVPCFLANLALLRGKDQTWRQTSACPGLVVRALALACLLPGLVAGGYHLLPFLF